jgi:ubiquinone/menaquinone biosynthesis C-methylase UbiE
MATMTAPASPASEVLSTRHDETYFSFEWFSSLAAYRDANRAQLEDFFARLRSAPPWQGIDVACGVGLMTELSQQIGDRLGRLLQRIVCVDLDRDAIKIARERLDDARTCFVQAVGQRLPLRDGFGSFLTIGNGIHNFAQEDKAGLLREAFRVVRSGAGVFFNSAFYEGTYVEGTERFYSEKVRRAVRILGRSAGRAARAGERPEAARPIRAQEYVRLVEEAGFTDVRSQEMEVRMDQELWEAICSYGGYAQGALHFKYDAEQSVRALVQAVRELFADPEWETKFPGMSENGLRFIPRKWLWVTALKPA